MNFREIRKSKDELNTLREIRQVIKNKMESASKPPTGERVQSSYKKKYDDLLIKQENLDMKILEKIEEITLQIEKFEEKIKYLKNPDERDFLRLYYLSDEDDELYRLEDVADRMNFSLSHVKRIHKSALKNLDKLENK